MRYIFFNIVAFIVFFYSSAFANSTASFTWLDTSDNAKLFQEIKTAFSQELQPDIPESVKPYIPYFYKYIDRIGSYSDIYIILIGYREHENDQKEYDYFRAFFYNRINRKKGEIQPEGVYYKFSFVGFANFESSLTPDVVFKYYDCLECEKVELLSSFMFDQKKNRWKIRIWPDNDPHLKISSDTQIGDDFLSYECLHAITDVNNDGFLDILIRCRKTAKSTKAFTEKFFFYTIQKGIAKKIIVQNKKDIDRMNSILCKGQKSPLCN